MRNLSGYWSGQKMIVTFIVLEMLLLVAVIVLYVVSLSSVDHIRTSYESLSAQPISSPKYSALEATLEKKFNAFYFAASCECEPIDHCFGCRI